MAGRGLEERLVQSGALRREAVHMAKRRQKVYGGGLDTVLLEMGLVDEGTLWALLVEDTGLAPLPPSLLEGPVIEPDVLIGYAEARRLGAFVFESDRADSDAPQAIVRPGFDAEALAGVLGGRPAEVFIVPEVRFEALLSAFYVQAIPPRFVSLLGRLMGAEQLRRWAATRAPRHRLPTPPVDVGPRLIAHEAPALPPPSPVIALHTTPLTDVAPASTFSDGATLVPQDNPHTEAVEPVDPPLVEAPFAAVPPALSDATGAARAPTATMSLLESLPHDGADGQDMLLAALAWHAELEGGPRAHAVAAAIATHWSADDIFDRLPRLAKRGEHVARTALPLLAVRANVDLLGERLRSPVPRHRVWAAQTLALCLRNSAFEAEAFKQITAWLCLRMEQDPEPEVRAAAAQAVRGMAAQPLLQTLLSRISALVADASALDPARVGAALLLGEMRADVDVAIQALIAGAGAKNQPVADTCHAALVRITGHEPGRGRAAWRRWWKKRGNAGRPAWLVAALEARRPDLRLAAANELAELTGQTFGYHFDLTPGQREAAVARWKAWLVQQTS